MIKVHTYLLFLFHSQARGRLGVVSITSIAYLSCDIYRMHNTAARIQRASAFTAYHNGQRCSLLGGNVQVLR